MLFDKLFKTNFYLLAAYSVFGLVMGILHYASRTQIFSFSFSLSFFAAISVYVSIVVLITALVTGINVLARRKNPDTGFYGAVQARFWLCLLTLTACVVCLLMIQFLAVLFSLGTVKFSVTDKIFLPVLLLPLIAVPIIDCVAVYSFRRAYFAANDTHASQNPYLKRDKGRVTAKAVVLTVETSVAVMVYVLGVAACFLL